MKKTKVRESTLRFKQYIERCPPREKPQEDRQVVLFIEGIKNKHLKKDLHLKKCMTLEEVTREAVYLVDNCQIYVEAFRDSDTMSMDSKTSSKNQSVANSIQQQVSLEQITENVIRNLTRICGCKIRECRH